MDTQSKEEFDRIIQLNPEDLSSDEQAFLRARRSYLNNEQRRVFKSVLTVVEPESTLPVDPPHKGKSKKA